MGGTEKQGSYIEDNSKKTEISYQYYIKYKCMY